MKIKPVYTDLISEVIKVAINKHSLLPESMLCGAGKINYDLSVTGSYLTTKKTINVADVNGRLYLITVEEISK